MRIIIEIEIDTEEKTVFFSHMGSSGCEYEASTPEEIAEAVKEYVERYINLEEKEDD